MPRYPLYIFDLDGTLYRGDQPIEHAADVLRRLADDGAKLRYLSNNSGAPPEHLLAKLLRMGFPVTIDDIYTSSTGSAKHLKDLGYSSVFAVGEPGLVSVLRANRIQVVNAAEDGVVQPDGGVSEAVVVGICRQFTYNLMNGAMQRIRAGQPFVATNADTTFPMEGGKLVPGAGSIVAGIQACSGHDPFVVGKPNPFLIELVLKDAGCQPGDALVVGDRMDTDIESGIRAGCPTHLVLTGVAHQAPEGQTFSDDMRGLL